ncbi:Zinc finger and BTB domain-containing protein 17 [Colletotrichum chlorophyti]|uniref:Zinc finger and BTB domain-containing protein 17 n=1 Tax=Colletotrichum chlorophyti TaxID=708187 RepID=A0A1Q8RGV5_9PEZI|nr:Zinc finger and BTB domain-containing protein 17 [Colletotrichum chlorophyti]
MTFTCGDCWREFPAGCKSRQQHLDATGHRAPEFECDTCDRYYKNRRSVEWHMDYYDHWSQDVSSDEWGCVNCGDVYSDEEYLRDHEVRDHFYCDPCNRYFDTWNNIRQHLNSSIHRGTSIQCPFCSQTRGTATGLIHHLEQGNCPNAPLDRDKLYQAVRRRDPKGLISKKLLDWRETHKFTATERTWNPFARSYQCYLCNRLFNSLVGLNAHLNSPVHSQALYHCPNRRCGRDFTTLAAVINHLESESCQYMRFDAVQRRVEHIVDPRRMIAL